MGRIALQILEDGLEQDGRVMQRAVALLQVRLAEPTDGRWAAAAFEINRIYNIMEKAFERLCEAFENHLDATRCVASFDGWCRSFLGVVRSRYHDELDKG
jgi:hypothetical protein